MIDMQKIESVETATAIVPMDIRPLIYEIRGRQATLDMLAKRGRGVKVELVQKEIYWSGASLKDAGRLTFARPCGLPSKASRFFGGYSAKLGAEMIPGLLASIRKATSATNNYKKGGRK